MPPMPIEAKCTSSEDFTLQAPTTAKYHRELKDTPCASKTSSSASSKTESSTTKPSASKSSSRDDDDEYVLRWASSGGGWRAQAASIGFANLFAKAGILGSGRGGKSSSKRRISAVSTNSGSTWFATQFFFSKKFHKKTLKKPEKVHDFVLEWMEAYLEMQKAIPSSPFCEANPDFAQALGAVFGSPGSGTEICDISAHFGGSWANFIQGMLRASSTNYGENDFPARRAGPDDKVKAMFHTDLLIQMSLAPNSRAFSGTGGDASISYLKSSWQPSDKVYSVPIAAQYAVKDTY